MRRGFRVCSVVAAVSFALLSGCTTLPEDPDERAEIQSLNDPLEPTNRAIFDVNMALDDAIMVPVAESYRSNLPDWFRDAVHNILTNLQEPYVAGNDLLQGNTHAAADSLGRFFINSTFGLLGARDAVADSGGAKSHKTDIGVTLAVWGIEEGPYLMLPLFGPSNLRDGTGKVAEFWASPTGAVLSANGLDIVNNIQTGAEVLDTRTNLLDPLKDLRRSSLDDYAAIRSLYRQSREASIIAARQGQSAPAVAPAPAATPAASAKPGTGFGDQKAPPVHGSVEFVDPAK
ncbi:MlaA family lipoprotein [Magnetospirillum fulvum]|uniref:Phospholipid-binding lipoprotein MlaA n=1 Tax=Magnetospirillum fulvum TaxID=1082 RepID=A0A1H6IAS4_MAGFU|nr:VacJ family lipoprotein [Magnetospirillum fulvum]SEH43945.1 phospholipid-binding lipoprotein MlaA [Magnetospirillum fulvum]